MLLHNYYRFSVVFQGIIIRPALSTNNDHGIKTRCLTAWLRPTDRRTVLAWAAS